MPKKMKVVELDIHATDFTQFHKVCDNLFLTDPDYMNWSYRAVFREAGPRIVRVHLIYDEEWKLFRLAWRFGRGG